MMRRRGVCVKIEVAEVGYIICGLCGSPVPHVITIRKGMTRLMKIRRAIGGRCKASKSHIFEFFRTFKMINYSHAIVVKLCHTKRHSIRWFAVHVRNGNISTTQITLVTLGGNRHTRWRIILVDSFYTVVTKSVVRLRGGARNHPYLLSYMSQTEANYYASTFWLK